MKKILTDDRLLKKYYPNLWSKLRNRLWELESVQSLSLISHKPPPRKHKLTGEFDGCYAVDLNANFRLVFKPTQEYKDSHQSNICSIEILSIIDYH